MKTHLGRLSFALLLLALALPGLGQTPCVPPPAGLTSWWRGENNTQDSVGTHHGTLQNGATYVAGPVGTALSFDGVDDFFSVPDSTDWDFGSSDLTIEFWTKLNQVKDSMFIHQQSGATTGGFEFDYQVGTPGALVFASSVDHGLISRPWSPAPDTWYHLAVVRSQNVCRLYVNGAQLGAEQADATPTVGCVPASGSLFHQGTTTVNCTATDASGNTNHCAFTVLVVETGLLLTIAPGTTNLILTWPQTGPRYVLEEKAALDPGLRWTPTSGPVETNGTDFQLTIAIAPTNKFFRLRLLAPVGSNGLANGGFESGNFTVDSQINPNVAVDFVPVGDPGITGWNVGLSPVDPGQQQNLSGLAWTQTTLSNSVPQGVRFADLTHSVGPDADYHRLSTTFPTIPGQVYLLSYASSAGGTLHVRVAGAGPHLDHDRAIPEDSDWRQFNDDFFIADSTSTTIEFWAVSPGTPASGHGPLLDDVQVRAATVAGTPDADHDGVPDIIEGVFGFSVGNPDIDDDGVLDGDEDPDGDGLPIRWEIAYNYHPLRGDTDGNGVVDTQEDSDGDGLSNIGELAAGTSPANPDSDGDGWNDEAEITGGSSPLNPASRPRHGLVAQPLLRVIAPGVGSADGLAFNTLVASPPLRVIAPALGSTDGLPLNTFVGQPPVRVIAPALGSPDGFSLNSVIAAPPVRVTFDQP